MEETDFLVRAAIPGDAPALGSLAAELGYPNTLAETEDRLRRVMDAADHRVLIAETADREIVGWVHVFGAVRLESDGFAELGGLVVAQGRRGLGVGASLVASAEQWALENAYHRLRIRSRMERTEAHRFFERIGFERRKTQRVFERFLVGNP